jgi:HEAT repeat protein
MRAGALLLCAYHPEEVSQETLVAALDDPTYAVGRAAIARLRTHSAPLPVQILLRYLYNADWYMRREVIAALGTMGTAAPLDDLIALLNDENPDIRATTLTTLRQPGLLERVPVEIFLNATNDSDPGIRAATLTALRQPGLLERVPVEIFLNATGDAELNVRNAALEVLKAKDRDLAIACCIAALGKSMPPHNHLAETYRLPFEILQEFHPTILPDIVQEVSTVLQGGKPGHFFSSLSMGFVAEIIGNMGRHVPELLERLGELLDWPYWEVRMKAAQALGKLRRNIPDATIRRLLELRHDPRSRAVREAADEALAEILSLETGVEDD